MTKQFILTIKVDEKNIARKYPNYKFNYNNPKRFINTIVKSLTENKLKKFGYSITIKSYDKTN